MHSIYAILYYGGNMNNVLDIFYNEIIKEASVGKIDCYFTYNILFNTIINDKKITESNIKDKLIPTLIIKDKDKFDSLLITYHNLAYEFYKDYRLEELDNYNYSKSLMSLIWSDATSEDFLNPCFYLEKRIGFIKNGLDTGLLKETTSSIGDIKIYNQKEAFNFETPYSLKIMISNDELPIVRFGMFQNKVYIYAIQNLSKTRSKTLNRSLYKVNEGLDMKGGGVDSIKDVTPSTLVSLLVSVAFFKSIGISDVVAPVMLISRWNAKELMYERKVDYMKKKNITDEDTNKYLKDKQEEHIKIQNNISQKFIDTFRRLEYHLPNIEITAMPFVNSIDLELRINDFYGSNNKLLEELYCNITNYNRNR